MSGLLGPVTANPLMLAQALKAREQPRKQLAGQGLLDVAATGLSPVPVIGDAIGLAADASRFYNEPESRTWGNVGLAALGLLPMIPSMNKWNIPKTKAPSGATMKMMSPSDYLNQVEAAQGVKFTDLPSPVYSEEKVNKLSKALLSGAEMEVPWIKYKNGKVVDQEGRHRAAAAINAGINEIPVYVFYK